MTVKEIIEKYLRDNGFDGLCKEECGCLLADFMPCGGEWIDDCMPAYAHPDDMMYCTPYKKEDEKEMKLKPCPFCGMPEEYDDLGICNETFTGETFWFGSCGNCGCRGPLEKTPKKAIKAWNTREEEK